MGSEACTIPPENTAAVTKSRRLNLRNPFVIFIISLTFFLVAGGSPCNWSKSSVERATARRTTVRHHAESPAVDDYATDLDGNLF